MPTYVDDRIKGKAIYISESKINRSSIPEENGLDFGLTAGRPFPVLQVNDYALNPTARSIDEVAVFGDINTGGETKPEIGDLGTTEVVLTGPMVQGSCGLDILADSVDNQKDVYLEYFLPGALETVGVGGENLSASKTFQVLDIDDSNHPFDDAFIAKMRGLDLKDDAVGGYGLVYVDSASEGLDDARGDTAAQYRIDRIITEITSAPATWVAGDFAIGDVVLHAGAYYQATVARTASDTDNPVTDTASWNEITYPDDILHPLLTRWPGNTDTLVDVATINAGKVWLYRPDKWIQLRVQALSRPSEAQAGAASFNGTINLVLQGRENESFFVPRG